MTDFRTAPAKLGPLAALFDTEHIIPETILSSPGPLAALFDTEHIIPETILSSPGPLAALFDTETSFGRLFCPVKRFHGLQPNSRHTKHVDEHKADAQTSDLALAENNTQTHGRRTRDVLVI